MQSSLSQKVNASDLASLVPQGGSDEGASLLPKLIELQNKLAQTEGEVVAHSQAHPPAFCRLQWWNDEAAASDNKADGRAYKTWLNGGNHIICFSLRVSGLPLQLCWGRYLQTLQTRLSQCRRQLTISQQKWPQ